jgi:hypothetical protein
MGMIFMSLRIARTFAATTAAILLLACGGDDARDDPKPATPPLPETPLPDTESTRSKSNGRSHLVERKSPDGKGMYLLGTDASGVEFEASIGENATIPKDFPQDVPIIPGAEPMAALSTGGGGAIVTLKSSEEQSKIRDFYLSELPKNGWAIQSESSIGGQLIIEATQGSRNASITIAGTSGDSRLSIILSDEP